VLNIVQLINIYNMRGGRKAVIAGKPYPTLSEVNRNPRTH
jgi:hypothetical protein